MLDVIYVAAQIFLFVLSVFALKAVPARAGKIHRKE